MKKIAEQFPKQKANIRKNPLTMQNVKSKTDTDIEKYQNISKKCLIDVNEAILSWKKLNNMVPINDQQICTADSTGDFSVSLVNLQKAIEDDEKSKILPIKNTQHLKTKNNSLKSETIKQTLNNHSKINSHNNALKSEVNNRCVKNVNLLNTNDLEPLKVEMEKMNNYMEQFNNNLKTVTEELSNEKNKNIVLMNSVKEALEKYQSLEMEQKIQEGLSYKEKLDSKTMELENVIVEKNDLLKHLKETEVELANAIEKINELSEKSDSEYAEKIKEIEDERLEWNSYQIQLENQITEDQKALSRKEQYIKNQDYMIENLTQEKLNLETRLNNPGFEFQSHQSGEIENYQNEIRQISAILADTKKTLLATKESHKKEMSETRDRLTELEKLIDTKNDLIHQQNLTLDLMREITPAKNDNSIITRRWP